MRLADELMRLIDKSGANSREAIYGLVAGISRIIEVAEDRQTAEGLMEMSEMFLSFLVSTADEDGSARWSNSRYH